MTIARTPAPPRDTAPANGHQSKPALNVAALLAHRAATDPTGPAVISSHEHVTFTAAVLRVARLAEQLAAAGIRPGAPVAVIAERSAAAVLARLAVLAAGAVCVPVDPHLPPARRREIVTDCKPAAVVSTDRRWADELDDIRWISAEPTGAPTGRPALAVSPDWPAYIAYTSGSTGAPKGVVVTHQSLANLYASLTTQIVDPAASVAGRRLRVAHALAMGFDASWMPLLWLLAGHTLHIFNDEERRDPAAFAAAVARDRIDVIETLPSQIEQLLDVGLLDATAPWRPSTLLMGGEPISPRLWRRLRDSDDVRAYNLYGPTETTIAVSWCDLSTRDTPSIGRPVTGTALHALTATGEPADAGDIGELVVTGTAVSAGYHHRPAETAERFLFRPGELRPIGYRTGDLCRVATDGEFEFVGRRDDQVKIRGHRVELGDIEATLGGHSHVRQVRVVLAGDRLLCAVVPASPSATNVEELRVYLAARLPDYMLPHRIVLRDALPVGPTGKVDTTALAAELTATVGPAGPHPRTLAEWAVAAVWERVLQLPPRSVSRDDDFISLGGHSLLLTLVVHGLDRCGIRCVVRDLADNPTVAELAARLTHARHASRPTEEESNEHAS